jgi:hypothetical protein
MASRPITPIQKRESYVKGISAEDLGFVWGPYQRGSGGFFGVDVERGRIPRFAEVRQAFLRLIQAHRFLPSSIPDLYHWR